MAAPRGGRDGGRPACRGARRDRPMSASFGTRLRRSTFAVPSVLALTTLLGLVAALLDDGAADAVGWLGLTLPLAAIIWAWRRSSDRA